MKISKYFILIFFTLFSTLFLSNKLMAATCYYQPGNNYVSGDILYGSRICNQTLINMFWSNFDFDKSDWDDGFGYYDCCNINKPLARTFAALWLLKYSASSSAPSNSPLRWAYSYSASQIDELDGRCGSGNKNSGARATTYWGPFIDDRTVLKWPFFYGEIVVERAGTIFHEARHADGYGHNGGDRCPRGASCDNRWSDNRANTYQVLFNWWFYAQGVNTTTAMRNYAKYEAQRIIDRGFVYRPPYTIY